jgi:hypothetical protein
LAAFSSIRFSIAVTGPGFACKRDRFVDRYGCLELASGVTRCAHQLAAQAPR